MLSIVKTWNMLTYLSFLVDGVEAYVMRISWWQVAHPIVTKLFCFSRLFLSQKNTSNSLEFKANIFFSPTSSILFVVFVVLIFCRCCHISKRDEIIFWWLEACLQSRLTVEFLQYFWPNLAAFFCNSRSITSSKKRRIFLSSALLSLCRFCYPFLAHFYRI